MKWTNTFIPTLKESPKEAEAASHKLMLRAALIQNLSSGLYIYLPLGKKVLDKVMKIIRNVLDESGAIELSMPALQPKALWEKSGRWEQMADLMMTIKDREDKEFALGPTHEEVITDLVSKRINSYRQLPINFYQIQTKFRDEIRPRFGVIRAKEFIMKDGYSFDIDEKGAFSSYEKMYKAYFKIFKSLGIDVSPVLASTGVMGDGGKSHEFMAVTDIGEDVIVKCKACGYAANLEMAERKIKDYSNGSIIESLPLELVDTPNVKSVEEVSKFFNVKSNKLIKTLIYKTDSSFTVVLIRGDIDVNEIKLKNILKCNNIVLADEKDIELITKAPQGFAGPIGIKGIRIIADLSIEKLKNAITGANAKDKHYKNVNLNRDFEIKEFNDIGICKDNDICPICSGTLYFGRGIEVGQVFYLGTKYSEKMNAKVPNEKGEETTLIMGCYGIGVSRTVAAIIECNHDESGILWPITVAPFEVVVTPLDYNDEIIKNEALRIYNSLLEKGYDVLLDDRDERPGFKFKDSELIGIPIRITIGKKSFEKGEVEIFERKGKITANVKCDNAVTFTEEKIKFLKEEIFKNI